MEYSSSMFEDFRPEEIEWFKCAEQYFEERQAQQPEFSASVAIDALKAEFLAQVPFDELLEMDTKLWQILEETEIPKPALGNKLEIVCLSWLAVTFRYSHSSFFLAQNGFRDTSVANSRVALDHAIYLSLLANGDERDRIASRMEALYLRFLKGFGSDPVSSNPDLDDFFRLASEEFPDLDPGQKSWSDIVKQVCDRLVTGDIVYSRYRILSNMMHPGLPSTEPFAYPVKYDSSPNFSWSPIINPANTVGFMAIASCVWAAWSIDHLLEVKYFGDVLNPIAERLKLHRLFES
jgi:hypothetical protein